MLAILNAEDDEARRCQDHHCAVKAAPLEEYDRSQASHGRRAPSEEEYKMRGSLSLTARQAATRVAMFFEKVFPEARPHFPRSARTFSVRVGHDEFRQIVGRKKYE